MSQHQLIPFCICGTLPTFLRHAFIITDNLKCLSSTNSNAPNTTTPPTDPPTIAGMFLSLLAELPGVAATVLGATTVVDEDDWIVVELDVLTLENWVDEIELLAMLDVLSGCTIEKRLHQRLPLIPGTARAR